MVAAQDVADFAGRSTDATFVAAAGESLSIVTAMVSAYTRGQGFTDGEPADDLAAVITTATARLADNPMLEVSEGVGEWNARHTPLTGFTLAELFILNRYRKRAT